MASVRAGAGSVSGRKRATCKKESDGLVVGNEDRVVVDEEHKLFAVFDGHGGSLCADYLAKNALARLAVQLDEAGLLDLAAQPLEQASTVSDEEEKSVSGDDEVFHAVAAAFLKTFEELEAEFQEVAEGTGDTSGACGLLAAYIGNDLYTGHCGDCRAIFRSVEKSSKLRVTLKSKNVVQMTVDHRVDGDTTEFRRVTEAGGVVENGRICSLSPSRTFGDWDIKHHLGPNIVTAEPDINVHHVNRPTLMLLATDGVWDAMSNKKAMEIVEKAFKATPEDLELVAQRLCEEASKTTRDDISAIVLAFEF